MKLNPKDRRQLFINGGIAFSAALMGAGLAWWATGEARQASISLRQAEQRASDIRNRLRQVNIEEQEIRAKSALFRQLEKRRIIGPENRLDWVELIDDIRERHRLFEISYDLTALKQDGAAVGEYRLNSSEMSLHLPLLHEGDLLVFLDELQRRAPALIQVRQCEILRIAGRSDRQGGDPNLDARCRLQWNTVNRLTTQGGGS